MKHFKKAGSVAFPGLLLGFYLLFFIYEIIRAIQVDFTYDEATTYLNYLIFQPHFDRPRFHLFREIYRALDHSNFRFRIQRRIGLAPEVSVSFPEKRHQMGGDRPFFLSILRRAILIFGLFTGLTSLIFFLGRLLNRYKILTREQFRPLVIIFLMLASLLTYPIFLFKKNQIFFGGKTGLVQDTVLTLIRSSF